ncbi:GNAT family N-acetyltransferase [Polluticaenibacter yanchengensis]|uniref:GNAT family N-acetyltransferase n=1 Tax=Polluticaenibacter yanchengensis TaxID=3014562 RepID=A0ABT4UPS2_9BACT|nr:GNAT family N-acetyltransferase [Chitinophagaceae bacterium LY-5]
MNISLKSALPEDVLALQLIARQTFRDTFLEHNTEENINDYFITKLSVEKLTAELLDHNSRFFFAVIDGNIVGYLKVNFGPAQTELQDSNGLEIERIYITKEYQGKKVAPVLFEKALSVAREAALKYVWLGVWEENKRAIKFYEKNGFKVFDTHVFTLGNEQQTDYLMKLAL